MNGVCLAALSLHQNHCFIFAVSTVIVMHAGPWARGFSRMLRGWNGSKDTDLEEGKLGCVVDLLPFSSVRLERYLSILSRKLRKTSSYSDCTPVYPPVDSSRLPGCQSDVD